MSPSHPKGGDLEGGTRLFSPGVNVQEKGPGRREKGQPFYNPGMALNRDLSVLIAHAECLRKEREIDFADPLAGTGARSARVAHEVPVPIIAHANDGNPVAVGAIRRTAEANGIPASRLQVTEGDAYPFLAARRYDVVDVDPHGSPMPFLDAALRATRPDGLVCITATDTGALAGKFPRVARRRYDAHHGLHAFPWRAEVGLRILGSAVVRSAARFDRAAVPVLSVAHGHWMRVVARVRGASQGADQALRQLSAAVPDAATGSGRFLGVHEPPPKGEAWAGPLWTGPLHDAGFVQALQAVQPGHDLARAHEVRSLLSILAAEAEAPAFWVFPDGLRTLLGPTPQRDILIGRLQAAGLRAARCHMDPQGIRTDAGIEGLRQAWLPA